MSILCVSGKRKRSAAIPGAAGSGRHFRLLGSTGKSHHMIRSAHDSFAGYGLAAGTLQVYVFVGTHENSLKNIAALHAPELKDRHASISSTDSSKNHSDKL
jgi:hypothetical protein